MLHAIANEGYRSKSCTSANDNDRCLAGRLAWCSPVPLLSLLAFCSLLALKYCTGGVHAAWLPACLHVLCLWSRCLPPCSLPLSVFLSDWLARCLSAFLDTRQEPLTCMSRALSRLRGIQATGKKAPLCVQMTLVSQKPSSFTVALRNPLEPSVTGFGFGLGSEPHSSRRSLFLLPSRSAWGRAGEPGTGQGGTGQLFWEISFIKKTETFNLAGPHMI